MHRSLFWGPCCQLALYGQHLAGLTRALSVDVEPSRALGSSSPAGMGVGRAGIPCGLGEGHNSVWLPRLFRVCKTQCSYTGPGWIKPGLVPVWPELSHPPVGVKLADGATGTLPLRDLSAAVRRTQVLEQTAGQSPTQTSLPLCPAEELSEHCDPSLTWL